MKENIRNIIFDWGGVLIDLDVEACFKAFESIGFKDVRKYISGTIEKGIFVTYEEGKCTTEEFRDGLREIIGRPVTDKQIDDAMYAIIKTVPVEKLELLAYLKDKYSLYMLSNTNDFHFVNVFPKVFSHNGVNYQECFKKIFVSHLMKLTKPDPEIFRQVLLQADIVPEETLFIDDSPVNCKAAAAFGIHTIHYVPGQDLAELLGVKVE